MLACYPQFFDPDGLQNATLQEYYIIIDNLQFLALLTIFQGLCPTEENTRCKSLSLADRSTIPEDYDWTKNKSLHGYSTMTRCIPTHLKKLLNERVNCLRRRANGSGSCKQCTVKDGQIQAICYNVIALVFRLMSATLNVVNIGGVSVNLHYLFELLNEDLFGVVVSDGYHMQYTRTMQMLTFATPCT